MHFDYSEKGSFQYEIVKASDRSIDRSLLRRRRGELERRKIGGKKTERRRKERERERKKEKRIELFLHDRSLEKKFTARSLPVPASAKEKIDFVFTSKRSDRFRYFATTYIKLDSSIFIKFESENIERGSKVVFLCQEEKIRVISKYRYFYKE